MPRRWIAAAVVPLALALTPVAAAEPILDPLRPTFPASQSAPATPDPITYTRAPRNRFMAPNPRSNIHNDTWMTDAYRRAGPVGRSPEALSSAMRPPLCGSLTFHSRGYIVSVCPSLVAPPHLRVIDPITLELLADYDLTRVLEDDERITSALPDFRGRIWFVSKKNGKVGILNPRTRRVRVIRLGEDIQNSFTVDRRGVYIVSSKRMYRFRARRGRPKVQWRRKYANSGIVKPGQADAGSGTTPTIMRGGYVAITDNADPMNVVVYRKAVRLRRGQRRVVCTVPVFDQGASATENSLMTNGRSLYVENNYGYQDPFGPNTGAITTPGFARVDVKRRGGGCRKVWTNTTERAPTVVPKLSTATGLIYTYTRDPAADPLGLGLQLWYWTAISAHTGATVFKDYAGLAIGATGTAYLGVTGGMVALRDR